ncbi:MAG: FdtA/QdtA family cupin domain-containing protein [Elusimicrobiota bacterium]|jgi:dTDP-4-dehydrorhamnose 3,5-epimerase-like enzyme|nr:FdtA/QdtA family cupin domain-containing protein [Elusimicrobiota bacterium]
MGFEIIELKSFGDKNGSLVPLEANRNVPFDIKRVYYIFGTKSDFVRGKHSHLKLKQYIICVSGSCDFYLDADAKGKKLISLNTPLKAIYIEGNVWREFSNFSKDCVILVLANQYYDVSDYIRNYEEFLECRKI